MSLSRGFLSEVFVPHDALVKRIIISLFFTFIIVIVIIYVSWSSFLQLEKSGKMVTHTHLLLARFDALLSSVKDAETGQRGYIITESPDFLLSYISATDSVKRQLKNIREMLSDNTNELKRLDQLDSLIEKKLMNLQAGINIKHSPPFTGDSSLIFIYGKSLTDKIISVVAEAKKEESGYMDKRNENVKNIITDSRNTILIFSCVVMAIVITSLFAILSELLKRTAVETLLKTVLDSSLSGIQSFKAVRDLTGKIIDFKFVQANITSYKLASATDYSYLGKTLLQVAPHIKSHELFNQYVKVVETGIPVSSENYYNHDGLNGWYRFVAVKLEDGFTVTFDDITEAKRTKIELENNLRALKRSNEELEQFANIASHDLQEPLRKILAFIDRIKIKNENVLSDESKTYFDRVVNSAYRMRTLINDLLKYSRVGNGEVETVTVDLNKLMTEILYDLEMVIQQKKADVVIGNLPVMEGREVQLRQLFQNLISNSLKFSDPLRTPLIEISASYIQQPDGRPLPETEVTQDSFCRIEVKDNGIGFDDEDADKIFRIFYRLHGRSEYEGSGIGLAICKKIVENHHGIIIAKGNLGLGSAFIILLPLSQKSN